WRPWHPWREIRIQGSPGRASTTSCPPDFASIPMLRCSPFPRLHGRNTMRPLAGLFITLAATAAVDPSLLKELKWRSIGPYRGARVTGVAGVPSQPSVYYFGSTGGGIWKTTDGGAYWEPVSDGQLSTGSVGAIGVSASDPNIVYVGMGEAPIRGNVSHGDGVY